MDRDEIREIAQRWVNCESEYEKSGKHSADSYEPNELVHDDPHKALKVILEVLSTIPIRPDNKLFQALAAGPFEVLLVYRGGKVVKQIEHEAPQNAGLRRLLGGVWQSTIEPEVWNSVLKLRSESW